ncbi:MAG: hypothetical protein QM811_27030 [Pirellulales bacterium]
MKILLPGFALAAGIVLAVWEGRDATGTSVAPTAQTPAALPTSTAVAASAADPAAAIFDRAKSELQRRRTIQARVRYQIDLFDQRLIGAGSYFQSGDAGEKKSRLELRMQMGDELIAWTECCDGRFVWSAGETGFGRQLSRLDLKRIRQKQEQLRGVSSFTDGSPWLWAGVPKLLNELGAHFEWDRAKTGYFEPDNAAAWSMRGMMRKSSMTWLLPKQTAAVEAATTPGQFRAFPQQMPGCVSLYIQQDSYFPRRIEYRRPSQDKDDQTPPERWPLCVVMEFTDVVLDRDLDDSVFLFEPNKQEELLDTTDGMLQGLGLVDPK